MPENVVKMPRSASPVARAGAGDISERELSRERSNLQSTPARLQPAHPKKQLFFTPVNKFTASCRKPSPHLARIRSCLAEYHTAPTKKSKMAPKAASMEDLTPTKRLKKHNCLEVKEKPAVCARNLHGIAEEEAAAKVARFMVVTAWRRRREEIRCLRRTLEFQVSCSERLRLQVCALKSLLDSDNCKVRLAMRELDRLKQLLKEKEAEKAVLEREKIALEDDICAAEDRASEMGIGWRNCRNELEGVRAAAALCEHALALERAAAADARAQRDHAYARLGLLEEDIAQQEELLSAAEADVAELRRDADEKRRAFDELSEQMLREREAHALCAEERASLSGALARAAAESGALRDAAAELRAELLAARAELAARRDWWPARLARMAGFVRSWLPQPVSVPTLILWSAVPAAHGCTYLARTRAAS